MWCNLWQYLYITNIFIFNLIFTNNERINILNKLIILVSYNSINNYNHLNISFNLINKKIVYKQKLYIFVLLFLQ